MHLAKTPKGGGNHPPPSPGSLSGLILNNARKDAHRKHDRNDLYSLLKRCEKAIGGKRGIGILSKDLRKLYLEI
jgi:hypothetical protein